MASQLGMDKRHSSQIEESDDDEPYVVTKRIKANVFQQSAEKPKLSKTISKELPAFEKKAKSLAKLGRTKTSMKIARNQSSLH